MPGTAEMHTCQPLGLDRVMIGMNQDPNPKIMIIVEDYENLKDATSAQFLDQAGVSDIPGSTQH